MPIEVAMTSATVSRYSWDSPEGHEGPLEVLGCCLSLTCCWLS